MTDAAIGEEAQGEEPMTETRRWLITGCLMVATIMNSLDTTIANVALPHIQGSVQASQEQITWVLTSYLIAAAIMTPMSSWLSQKFGRKRLLLMSIAGFTIASALCGAATSLPEIVLYRFLQGVFGASLIPVSQAVLLDTFPTHRHGEAMAMWGQGAMLGPIMGPALGGWITDNLDWRWVFLINVPIGALALFGMWTFISDKREAHTKPFDFFGFTTLTLGVAGLQLMLDRGPSRDWFGSAEIWTELIVAVLGWYLFTIHTATARRPFFERALLHDRNFMAATIIGFFLGVLLFSSMALLPTMMQTLLGYPVLATGLVGMPRGLGSFVSMFLVGRMITRFDPRAIVLGGLGMSAVAVWWMTQFSLQMDSHIMVWSGLIQGLGMGMIFVPLSTLAFATLSPGLRGEGAAVYTLIRSMGSAIGISLMQAQHSSALQNAHARLGEHMRPDAPNVLAAQLDLSTPVGAALSDALVSRQAAMMTYVHDFQLLLLMTIALAPLLLLVSKPKTMPAGDIHVIMD